MRRRPLRDPFAVTLIVSLAACSTTSSSTPTVGPDAGDASADVAPDPTCGESIDAYCASNPCVRTWSEAVDPVKACGVYGQIPNYYGEFSVQPACNGAAFDVIGIQVGIDCSDWFYYAHDTGSLVQVTTYCNVNPCPQRCAAGSTPPPSRCAIECPGTNTSCKAGDAGGQGG